VVMASSFDLAAAADQGGGGGNFPSKI